MTKLNKIKRQKELSRSRRIRAKIKRQINKPRFSVFRSNKHIFGQLIDDQAGKTLVSANDSEVNLKDKKTKTILAEAVGFLLAEKARAQGIEKVVFDRGPYKYHGRLKALAEGARKGGLKF